MSRFVEGPSTKLPNVVIDSNLNKGPISLQKWKVWVSLYGPMCAAWLVHEFRRTIRQAGGFKVFVPNEVDISIQSKAFRWFKLSLSYLRKSWRWQVRERRNVKTASGTHGTEFEFVWRLSLRAKVPWPMPMPTNVTPAPSTKPRPALQLLKGGKE